MVPPLDDTYPRLVGDIGGTQARFALIRAPGAPLDAISTLPCADFPGPVETIERFLAAAAQPRPRWCALGIASPVLGDRVRMTNHHWAFSIADLQACLGFAHLEVINDFTALALALPALPPSELEPVGGGRAVAGGAIGLLGAGTGLGVSGLIPCGADFVPLAGEGGHVTLPARDAHEAALIAWLARRHGHVSAERVLSGPGLEALYEAAAAVAGQSAPPLGAAEITRQALAGNCERSVAAVDSFCAFLGTIAANIALTLGARGGVYIGGGIVPKLGPLFARSRFRARFEDKGRYSGYLAQIPTWVIQAPYPGLIGAARALERTAANQASASSSVG